MPEVDNGWDGAYERLAWSYLLTVWILFFLLPFFWKKEVSRAWEEGAKKPVDAIAIWWRPRSLGTSGFLDEEEGMKEVPLYLACKAVGFRDTSLIFANSKFGSKTIYSITQYLIVVPRVIKSKHV